MTPNHSRRPEAEVFIYIYKPTPTPTPTPPRCQFCAARHHHHHYLTRYQATKRPAKCTTWYFLISSHLTLSKIYLPLTNPTYLLISVIESRPAATSAVLPVISGAFVNHAREHAHRTASSRRVSIILHGPERGTTSNQHRMDGRRG